MDFEKLFQIPIKQLSSFNDIQSANKGTVTWEPLGEPKLVHLNYF
jgi:hypothetical protein